jgi:hypothetical protein
MHTKTCLTMILGSVLAATYASAAPPTLVSKTIGVRTDPHHYQANSGGMGVDYFAHKPVSLKRGQKLVIHLSDPVPAQLSDQQRFTVMGMQQKSQASPAQQMRMELVGGSKGFTKNPYFQLVDRTTSTITIVAKKGAPVINGASGGTLFLSGMSKYDQVPVSIVP